MTALSVHTSVISSLHRCEIFQLPSSAQEGFEAPPAALPRPAGGCVSQVGAPKGSSCLGMGCGSGRLCRGCMGSSSELCCCWISCRGTALHCCPSWAQPAVHGDTLPAPLTATSHRPQRATNLEPLPPSLL